MTTPQYQSLTAQAVREATETLMLLHDQTTTLEVKNYLRQQNYQAGQKEVSGWMHQLSTQHNWRFTHQNNYRVYRFWGDTRVTKQHYLEKGNQFWSIEVDGKTHQIEVGTVGYSGTFYQQSFKSNRFAVYQAQNLLKQKESSGYQIAQDTRLALALRQTYQSYFDKNVSHCTLAYFGTQITETQKATFLLNQQKVAGELLISKSAGYEFSVPVNNLEQDITILFQNKTWSTSLIANLQSRLTGEKIIQQTAILNSGEKMANYTLEQTVDKPILKEHLVDNENLYRIVLTFSDGDNLVLSKFELDRVTEMIPLLKQILK